MWMPALASANSGTITKLVHGCRRCWRRSLGEIAEATRELGRAGELGRGLLAERARLLGDALEVDARRRVGAGDQPDREAGDHRVDARLQQRHPHRRRRAPPRPAGAIRAARSAARTASANSPAATASGDDVDVLGVGGGDHDQRHEVVDHRERQQPHAQARRARREEASAPSANAVSVDIAAPQPSAPAPPALKARKISDRHRHAAERGGARGARSGAARAAGPGRARAWPRARRRGRRTSSGPR